MRLMDDLAGELRQQGYLSRDWNDTFRSLDRAQFIPDVVWVPVAEDGGRYHRVDRTQQPDRWEEFVYGDHPVMTKLGDADGPDTEVGLYPISSASQPRMVTSMLAHLDVQDGHHVLELGTGVGYNAALLARRLGDRHVTTIETDPDVAVEAKANLGKAGCHPALVVGDGTLGHPDGGPYDRIIATYAVEQIPYAWIEQARPGTVIVVPWATGLHNGMLLRLVVGDDGTATGQPVGDAAFMWDRGQDPNADEFTITGPDVATSTTTTDVRPIWEDYNVAWALGLQMAGVRMKTGFGEGSEAEEATLWLSAPDGSAASVDYMPNLTRYAVDQSGERWLWDEAEAALAWWQSAGRPDRMRFGMTVSPHGQRVWLDTPDTPLP